MLELVTEQTPLEQLGVGTLRSPLVDSYNRWAQNDSLGIMTDPSARMSCRGVASQLITPEHVEFSKRIEVIHPPEERFIHQTDYSLSTTIDEAEHSAEIISGWEDKKFIVAPVLGIKNGHPEEFAFMLPGRGIVYDRNEENRLKQIIEEQSQDIAPHVLWMNDREILGTLRHISLVVGDDKRVS